MMAPGGAMIVMDTDASPVTNPLSRIGESAPGVASDTSAPLQNALPADAGTESQNGTASVRRPASSVPARRAASSRGREDDLMATLMKIIGDGDASPKSASPESMDALIGDILASSERADQDTRDALAAIGGERPVSRREASRAKQAQQELATCPAVNTIEGLRCRDRICSRYAGEHPFCPSR
ncbi:hypothetical protein [Luteimonas terrae]|uniref:Uncharacterized protein n=1 Tax=Luteimonas terrae TaxID=1530191 RepID=A0ABU1XWJ4_9GAMM|nr:hypothetical protein [Luteimonas terrae]MDR7192620.1 hypothetical protein [Luteimonas terrae]